MREPTRPENPTPEQLAGQLRERARAAATAAVRAGLQEIDSRYGMHVADEVVRSLDIGEVFAGLLDEQQDTGGRTRGRRDSGGRESGRDGADDDGGSMFEVRLTHRP